MNDIDRSLKSLNMNWLVLLVVADILVVLLFVAPELLDGASITAISVGRLLLTPLAPVVVLLIVNALPHDIKSVLVYWRLRHVLPGHRAFTAHGPADSRIDMKALTKNVGSLPTEHAAQNSKWYQLYKMVAREPAVMESHKLFLLYRDIATLSLPLIVLVPATLYFAHASNVAVWLAVALFAGQYILAALSARSSGIRFVCNVLAEHSARKIASPKPRSPAERTRSANH